MVSVVPCTTRAPQLPFQPAMALDKSSFAMCDQVKSISRPRLRRVDRTRLLPAHIDAVKFALQQMIDTR
jgi:mRNA interferase MazF